MNIDNTKNMVILKDLPSNIVDEAIVILKPNVKIKSMDLIDKKSTKDKKGNNPKKYIVNEAQMVVSSYISKIEKEKKNVSKEKKEMESKYKKARAVSFFLGVLFIFSLFF